MSMNPMAYNPSALATQRTGRHDINGTSLSGSEMTRLADKIIEYEGDQAGLDKLRAEFGLKFGRTKPRPVIDKNVEELNWRIDRDDCHIIYSNVPKVVTTDKRIYAVFVSVMCGVNLVDACRANHISTNKVQDTIRFKKIWTYTEMETGRKVTASNYVDLAKKAKKYGLDAPYSPTVMSHVVYTNGGSYERRTRGRHAPKNKKTGLIGIIDKKIYVQEVVYKGADDGQGNQA